MPSRLPYSASALLQAFPRRILVRVVIEHIAQDEHSGLRLAAHNVRVRRQVLNALSHVVEYVRLARIRFRSQKRAQVCRAGEIHSQLHWRSLPKQRSIGARNLSDNQLVFLADPISEIGIDGCKTELIRLALIDHLFLERAGHIEEDRNHAASRLVKDDGLVSRHGGPWRAAREQKDEQNGNGPFHAASP